MATKLMLCLPIRIGSREELLGQYLQKGGGNRNIIARRQQCTMRAQTQNSNLLEERRSPNFQPNSWNYDYLRSLEIDLKIESYKYNSESLEATVRSMIKDKNGSLKDIVALVNSIERLGLSHRFQGDIRSALDRVVSTEGVGAMGGLSLHDTALCFRILRQHGFQVSQEVFTKFEDEKGGFQESLQEDIEGMLSLYEASHLAMEGETMLDEAKAFTRSHLQGLKIGELVSSEKAEEVSHALDIPLHHRIERQETRWSIENWIKKGDQVNQTLLELAVLDFNLVQSVYLKEIGFLTRWWSGLGIAKRLSFSRDRIVESFFWAVGLSPSPELTSCRIAMAQLAQLITTIDDVFDVYGTLGELELFCEAVERWDIHAVENLPNYMKLCFLALYNTINEMGFEILKEQEANAIPYFAKAWTDVCKSFLQEVRWNYNKSMPSFEEYVENAWLSSSGPLLLVHAHFWVGQGFSKQQLQFLHNHHELLRLPSLIFRFCNDLATSSAEIARGETVNSISSYMNEAGVPEKAREHIHKLIEEAWKKMNKYLVAETPFPKVFVETAINLARISHLHYQHGDGHGAPDAKAKTRIQSLIFEPILMIK